MTRLLYHGRHAIFEMDFEVNPGLLSSLPISICMYRKTFHATKCVLELPGRMMSVFILICSPKKQSMHEHVNLFLCIKGSQLTNKLFDSLAPYIYILVHWQVRPPIFRILSLIPTSDNSYTRPIYMFAILPAYACSSSLATMVRA